MFVSNRSYKVQFPFQYFSFSFSLDWRKLKQFSLSLNFYCSIFLSSSWFNLILCFCSVCLIIFLLLVVDIDYLVFGNYQSIMADKIDSIWWIESKMNLFHLKCMTFIVYLWWLLHYNLVQKFQPKKLQQPTTQQHLI